ncbi:Cytochrome-c peroxidase [Sulfurimonas denitrificans DSM 1251]|uniref:Cytochrome-c peroxidase n=1 Tax=Sulfurimonas denitrificans (strain ATCC 33889 / DSM 1251) TaxID=326298 RepID=Q30Q69_SULDN|nr:cytochrome c peroxidase [Sulfurimonas denitrificans]ABB44862.1 Cytochrome-c peroxidase [Sulfurimonas denitrificans DSM 1251]MDD3443293.1 cytochrome c peroxidase [Sulfurimonas denitrificans]
MKRLLFYTLIIAIMVLSVILSIAYLTPPKVIPQYSDDKLRELALFKGLKSTPNTYEKLLELVDDASNPMSASKIVLGEKLFFDVNLSKNRQTSCSTCHSFDRDLKNRGAMSKMINSPKEQTNNCVACHLRDQSGVDRFTFSQGDNQEPHPNLLNTQSILNTAFSKHFTWSGEVSSLRQQSENSFLAYHKMNITADELVLRVGKSEKYRAMFSTAFQDDITFENINKAIEVYVKTLVTRGAYDRFLDGDNSAISSDAKRGLANFIGFGCKGCHSDISLGGQSIQRFPLRDFAQVYDLKPNFELFPEFKRFDGEFPFENSGGFLGKNKEHLFRVPILRNVTKTSPYFHNGAVPKIREAVNVMAKHQLGRHLTLEQIDEIVAFLRTLEGDIIEYEIRENR